MRVRVGLHALGHVPARAIALDQIGYGPERDVRVIADPCGAREDEGKERQEYK
jgi:hypothetical protein